MKRQHTKKNNTTIINSGIIVILLLLGTQTVFKLKQLTATPDQHVQTHPSLFAQSQRIFSDIQQSIPQNQWQKTIDATSLIVQSTSTNGQLQTPLLIQNSIQWTLPLQSIRIESIQIEPETYRITLEFQLPSPPSPSSQIAS